MITPAPIHTEITSAESTALVLKIPTNTHDPARNCHNLHVVHSPASLALGGWASRALRGDGLAR